MPSKNPSKTPVLIIGYNRVDLLAELLEETVSLGRRVFVHLDGPRSSQDYGQFECRDFVESIKRDGDYRNIEVNIQDKNLGCKNGVLAAIDWVFSQCDAAIILEDDIRFDSTFLYFCDQLLDEFQNSNEIFSICGYSPLRTEHSSRMPRTYFKSRNMFIWGWATWKSRWHNIDIELKSFDRNLDIRRLRTLSEYKLNRHFSTFWRQRVDRVLTGFDTWDIQILYLMWCRGMKSLIPIDALTTNIGFDERATHTKTRPGIYLPKTGGIEFSPLSSSRSLVPLQVKNTEAERLDYLVDKALISLRTQAGLITEFLNFFSRVKSVSIRFKNKVSRSLHFSSSS